MSGALVQTLTKSASRPPLSRSKQSLNKIKISSIQLPLRTIRWITQYNLRSGQYFLSGCVVVSQMFKTVHPDFSAEIFVS